MFDDRNLYFDLFALGLLACTIFLGLALLTYSPADPLGEAAFPLNRFYQPDMVEYPPNEQVQNACGLTGAICADAMLRVFGLGAYYVLACLAIVDVFLLLRRPIDGAPIRLTGWLAAFVGGLALLEIFVPSFSLGPIVGPGGYLGALGKTFVESHFATVGSIILLSSVILGGLLLCTDYVFLHVAVLAGTALINMIPSGSFSPSRLFGGLRRSPRKARRDAKERYEGSVNEEEEEVEDQPSANHGFGIRVKGRRVSDLESIAEQLDGGHEEDEYEEDEYEVDDEHEEEGDEEEAYVEEPTGEQGVASALAATGSKLLKGKSSDESERDEVIAQLEEASRDHDPQDYELPPLDLLLQSESYSVEELKREVQRKAGILEKTFQDFNLDVRVVDIETGPVIAQYEVELKRGLRLSKITGLADDLAIALRVPSVRIVAPIPGKNTVGIEVPNDQRQIVRLREVMEETNGRVKRMSIPVFLGKDVAGNPLAADLASLPHLLIAGRTGTGKSVCLNAIISSILMTKTPDDVRMLMIDPKMVELSGYARLPHLMHPVVTDMRKAEAILAWACDKMDERYRLLARAGVRHMTSYNQLGEEELMDRLQPETEEERESIPRHLPFIVIVADEMADLMMTAGKEVEAHIIRLAAKSRAVGIHLILATQKPTVDVITGLIKSNLPARIAFQVASRTDSRVVLDEQGADKLLGNGDMLFLWPGTSTLLRGQGTFLTDDEITRVVDYCDSNGEQRFVSELVSLKVEQPEGEVREPKKRDELYDSAVEIVIREGRGSVSLLQRNLQIGYGRAARLIDFMAEDGVVGTYNGSQARDVLMTLADWEAISSGAGEAAQTSPSIVNPKTWSEADELAEIRSPAEEEDDKAGDDNEFGGEEEEEAAVAAIEEEDVTEEVEEEEEDDVEEASVEYAGEEEDGEEDIAYEDCELEDEEDEDEEDEVEEDEVEEDDDEYEDNESVDEEYSAEAYDSEVDYHDVEDVRRGR